MGAGPRAGLRAHDRRLPDGTRRGSGSRPGTARSRARPAACDRHERLPVGSGRAHPGGGVGSRRACLRPDPRKAAGAADRRARRARVRLIQSRIELPERRATMARKVVYERSGEPAQVVRVVAGDEPQAPQRGQVLVRVTAFSVHPGDLAGIAGPFAGADGDALVPGAEATGTVEAIGPDTPAAAGVRVGARVTVFLVPGAWQDWVLAPAELVVAVPDDVPI